MDNVNCEAHLECLTSHSSPLANIHSNEDNSSNDIYGDLHITDTDSCSQNKSTDKLGLDLIDDIIIAKNDEQKAQHVTTLEKLVEELKAQLKEVKGNCTKLEEDNMTLLTNVNNIWKTAVRQIRTKEQELVKCKQQSEAIIFRRAMREISQDELERVVSRIAAYNKEEFSQFLDVLKPRGNEIEFKCRKIKPNVSLPQVNLTSMIESSVRGKKITPKTGYEAQNLQHMQTDKANDISHCVTIDTRSGKSGNSQNTSESQLKRNHSSDRSERYTKRKDIRIKLKDVDHKKSKIQSSNNDRTKETKITGVDHRESKSEERRCKTCKEKDCETNSMTNHNCKSDRKLTNSKQSSNRNAILEKHIQSTGVENKTSSLIDNLLSSNLYPTKNSDSDSRKLQNTKFLTKKMLAINELKQLKRKDDNESQEMQFVSLSNPLGLETKIVSDETESNCEKYKKNTLHSLDNDLKLNSDKIKDNKVTFSYKIPKHSSVKNIKESGLSIGKNLNDDKLHHSIKRPHKNDAYDYLGRSKNKDILHKRNAFNYGSRYSIYCKRTLHHESRSRSPDRQSDPHFKSKNKSPLTKRIDHRHSNRPRLAELKLRNSPVHQRSNTCNVKTERNRYYYDSRRQHRSRSPTPSYRSDSRRTRKHYIVKHRFEREQSVIKIASDNIKDKYARMKRTNYSASKSSTLSRSLQKSCRRNSEKENDSLKLYTRQPDAINTNETYFKNKKIDLIEKKKAVEEFTITEQNEICLTAKSPLINKNVEFIKDDIEEGEIISDEDTNLLLEKSNNVIPENCTKESKNLSTLVSYFPQSANGILNNNQQQKKNADKQHIETNESNNLDKEENAKLNSMQFTRNVTVNVADDTIDAIIANYKQSQPPIDSCYSDDSELSLLKFIGNKDCSGSDQDKNSKESFVSFTSPSFKLSSFAHHFATLKSTTRLHNFTFPSSNLSPLPKPHASPKSKDSSSYSPQLSSSVSNRDPLIPLSAISDLTKKSTESPKNLVTSSCSPITPITPATPLHPHISSTPPNSQPKLQSQRVNSSTPIVPLDFNKPRIFPLPPTTSAVANISSDGKTLRKRIQPIPVPGYTTRSKRQIESEDSFENSFASVKQMLPKVAQCFKNEIKMDTLNCSTSSCDSSYSSSSSSCSSNSNNSSKYSSSSSSSESSTESENEIPIKSSLVQTKSLSADVRIITASKLPETPVRKSNVGDQIVVRRSPRLKKNQERMKDNAKTQEQSECVKRLSPSFENFTGKLTTADSPKTTFLPFKKNNAVSQKSVTPIPTEVHKIVKRKSMFQSPKQFSCTTHLNNIKTNTQSSTTSNATNSAVFNFCYSADKFDHCSTGSIYIDKSISGTNNPTEVDSSQYSCLKRKQRDLEVSQSSAFNNLTKDAKKVCVMPVRIKRRSHTLSMGETRSLSIESEVNK